MEHRCGSKGGYGIYKRPIRSDWTRGRAWDYIPDQKLTSSSSPQLRRARSRPPAKSAKRSQPPRNGWESYSGRCESGRGEYSGPDEAEGGGAEGESREMMVRSEGEGGRVDMLVG